MAYIRADDGTNWSDPNYGGSSDPYLSQGNQDNAQSQAANFGVTDPNQKSADTNSGGPDAVSQLYGSGGFGSQSDAVTQLYRTALGRDPEAGAIDAWISGTGGDMAKIQQGIYGSQEAQAYSQQRSNSGGQQQQQTTTTQGTGNPLLDQIAQWSQMAGADPSLTNDPNYWARRITETGGLNAGNQQYWQNAATGPTAFFRNPGREGTTASYGAPAGGSYSSTNPFSDPATKNYIDLLNSRIQALLQPQSNPQMDSLLQFMNQYFQQLQGPTYTDAQRSTIATQQLDPMERQRQAELKNVATTMASRGITPGSGPYLQAERDINQKYDSLRAQTQGGIANNEITLGRQNQAQAVDVGSAAAQLVNGMNQQQDARANQAVGYGAQIPNIAQQRMSQAIQLLNGNSVNPASLVSSLQGFQQQGINQNQSDANSYSAIIAALAKAFGL